MILGEYKELFLIFSGLVFLSSILIYLVLTVIKFKTIIKAFKGIPIWFIFINLAVLAYKLFVIPSIITRNNFGVWILGMAKSETIWTSLLNQRAPVYFFIIKICSFLFDGISFIFISNFNIVLSFLTAFFVYYIIYILLKDKLVACISALFYILASPIFIYSMTEGYTNPALFFAIQALFFIVLYISKKDYSFLLMGIASSYLAVGSRPEYIIFDLIFLVFLYLFVSNINLKHYLIYLILFLPKFFIALNMYLENITEDEFLIGKTFVYHNLVDYIYKIFVYRWHSFINNFYENFLAIINPFSLMGIFLFFALFFIIKWKKSKPEWKKVYLFFLFYYFIFFFYYSFLHMDGIKTCKYISSMVLPIAILASIGLRMILGFKKKIGYYFILFIFIFYSLWIGNPITYSKISKSKAFYFFNNRAFMGRYLDPDKISIREWNKYTSLTIGNRYDSLINRASLINIINRSNIKDNSKLNGENNINLSDKNVFISNGIRNFLYSISIDEKIHTPLSLHELKSILMKVEKNENIYIAQSVLGFDSENSNNFSHFKAINPVEFEKYIKEKLFLEEELISYYDNEHHVFLYKMRKK